MKKVISNLRKKSNSSSLDNESVNETSSLRSLESIGSTARGAVSMHSNHRRDSQYSQHSNPTTSQPKSTHEDSSKIASSPSSSHDAPAFQTYDNTQDSDAYTTTFKSFQYSYNSNSNSLFSSSRTMSTGASSSAPSSNMVKQQKIQSQLDKQEKLAFPSMARPLMVLNEEDFNEEDEFMPMNNINDTRLPTPSRSSFNFPTSSSLPSVDEGSTFQTNNHSGYSGKTQTRRPSQPTTAQLSALCEYIERQLKLLSMTVSSTLFQVSQSVLNLTKASISVGDSIKSTIFNISNHPLYSSFSQHLPPGIFNTVTSTGLRLLILKVLALIDNLLISEVYANSRAHVLKHLHDLFLLLHIFPKSHTEPTNYSDVMNPQLFSIGSTVKPFPAQQKVTIITDLFVEKFGKSKIFTDQDGSFIAPVLRGFQTPELSVMTFIFGFPTLTKEHQDVVRSFEAASEDFHFMCQSNYIKLASGAAVDVKPITTATPIFPPVSNTTTSTTTNRMYNFKAPFRTLNDSNVVPISMSLGCDKSSSLSGTLGGYLYPKISKSDKSSKLRKYADSVFGLTCAHVVLNEETMSDDGQYPSVSVPSPVLINLYKKALIHERSKYNSHSEEYLAYNGAIEGLMDDYPEVEVKTDKRIIRKNVPKDKLGQIIWGERIINKFTNKLSDIAIIKIDETNNDGTKDKKKYLNFLGDDVSFNEYDPSLMFSNLQVREIVNLYKPNNSHIGGDNSIIGSNRKAGLEVFKYGSTTKYTNGTLNGAKIVYWSDGSLKSSEFIIRSSSASLHESNSKTGKASSGNSIIGFASGGDSGSWILTKLADYYGHHDSLHHDEVIGLEMDNNKPKGSIFEQFQEMYNINIMKQNRFKENEAKTGLGVVGMLHSFDGEFKQFGLFTPISDILDRLNEVTGVDWGVVGCSENSNYDDDEVYGEDLYQGKTTHAFSDLEDDENSEEDSTIDGSAFPPTI